MWRSRALQSLAWSQLGLRASRPLLRLVDVGSPVCPRAWKGREQGTGARRRAGSLRAKGKGRRGPATGGGGHSPPRSHPQLHSLDRADKTSFPSGLDDKEGSLDESVESYQSHVEWKTGLGMTPQALRSTVFPPHGVGLPQKIQDTRYSDLY